MINNFNFSAERGYFDFPANMGLPYVVEQSLEYSDVITIPLSLPSNYATELLKSLPTLSKALYLIIATFCIQFKKFLSISFKWFSISLFLLATSSIFNKHFSSKFSIFIPSALLYNYCIYYKAFNFCFINNIGYK